jgi:peptidoglycan/LPS O-acetylase OafA/YrhL
MPNAAPSVKTRTIGQHIVGIDTLRAVAATAVVFAHSGVINPEVFGDRPHGILEVIRMLSNCAFNGPAGVIIFFVISGFCIHYPQTRNNAGPFDLRTFYLRRSIRLGIPALTALAVYQFTGVGFAPPYFGVLWSIICEAIYYLLYPGLLIISRRVGWPVMIVLSYVVAVIMCLTHMNLVRDAANGYTLGYYTWTIGLPVWLLGCWVAENRGRFPAVSNGQLWTIRGAIFALTVGLRIMKFHMPFGVIWSNDFWLNAFAIPVAFWIGLEIASSESTKSMALEWVGQRSYSLYLIHPVMISIFKILGIATIVGLQATLLLQITAAFLLAFVFYTLIEHPSHRLAVSLSRRQALVTAAMPHAVR